MHEHADPHSGPDGYEVVRGGGRELLQGGTHGKKLPLQGLGVLFNINMLKQGGGEGKVKGWNKRRKVKV